MLHKSLLAQGHNCPHRAFFFRGSIWSWCVGKICYLGQCCTANARNGANARITFWLSVARLRGPRGAGGRECVPEAEPVAVCVGCARPPPPGAPGPRAARRPMTDRQPRAACLCRSIRSEDRSVHAHTHTVHMPLAPPHLNTSTAPHTKSQSHHSRPLSPSTAVSSRHNTSTQGQCHSHRTTYHTHNRRFTGYTALAV